VDILIQEFFVFWVYAMTKFSIISSRFDVCGATRDPWKPGGAMGARFDAMVGLLFLYGKLGFLCPYGLPCV